MDTHVCRLSLKFGLTDHREPVKIEKDLMQLLPREQWFAFTYRLIDYGRAICPAGRHDCRNHPSPRLYPEAAERRP